MRSHHVLLIAFVLVFFSPAKWDSTEPSKFESRLSPFFILFSRVIAIFSKNSQFQFLQICQIKSKIFAVFVAFFDSKFYGNLSLFFPCSLCDGSTDFFLSKLQKFTSRFLVTGHFANFVPGVAHHLLNDETRSVWTL